MKTLLLLSFLITSCLYGQEVIYFNKDWKRTTRDSAAYSRKTEAKENGYAAEFFYIEGATYSSGFYSSLDPNVREGKFTYYTPEGRLTEIENYRNNKLHGKSVLYHKNGQPYVSWNYVEGLLHDTSRTYYEEGMLKRYEVWDKGEFVTGKVYDRKGWDTAFYRYEEMAVYAGGSGTMHAFIKKQVVYPKKARRKNIQGKVFVKFVINELGEVRDITVIKGVHPLLDTSAVETVAKMPNWLPARMDGKPVKCYFSLPINFKLSD